MWSSEEAAGCAEGRTQQSRLPGHMADHKPKRRRGEPGIAYCGRTETGREEERDLKPGNGSSEDGERND